jgi:predicted AAA+ superfamily ATPase
MQEEQSDDEEEEEHKEPQEAQEWKMNVSDLFWAKITYKNFNYNSFPYWKF